MAEAQKWVYHLHLEMTVLIAVAGENGRIVIQGGAEFNTITHILLSMGWPKILTLSQLVEID